MPRVTVYIPAYNHERFVGDAISSVLAQTFADFELIVTDDGSTDGTLAEIRRFDDPRLKVHAFPQNRGACAAANHCLAHATGDYVAPLSSDDLFKPDKLRRQVAFLDEHPEITAVAAQAAFIDDDGHPLTGDHAFASIFTRENRSREHWLRHFFLHGNCLCLPTMMYRRTAHERARGMYHDLIHQLGDFDFWVRVCMTGQIHVMEDVVTLFRVRSGNQNVSAPTLENDAMLQHEQAYVLRHYLQPEVLRNIVGIFGPEWGPPCPPHLALAEIAWAQGSPAHRLFAVQAMLEAPGASLDEEARAILRERARTMLREADVFGQKELARLISEKQRLRDRKNHLEEKLAITRAKLEEMRDRLARMENSLAWKLIKPLRKLGGLLRGRK